MRKSSQQLWSYRDANLTQRNLAGLSVEAIEVVDRVVLDTRQSS